ncbi:MAG TPA: SDR family oxidoreductase [Burkholderiales bacterium]|nr:SDR family oxidoreductase [Burkholderiales bacterium]
MTKRRAIVTGASGLVGSYLITHLLEQGGWDIVALSRRKPNLPGRYTHIPVDLLDRVDCRSKLASLTDISHVFFVAYIERTDPRELVEANTAMLVNLVDVIEAASPALEHVHLSEGTKWYGNHLGPFKTPAVEDDPRHMPPNFYYNQQDFLEERQKGRHWTWSAVRPHAVCGFSTGGPMNLTLAIAVYAVISKELGLPLSFPGKPGAYSALYQATDAALLAKGITWMATAPKAANQAFNITNGDLIRWQNVWPQFADFFGMELAPPRHMGLKDLMADKAPVWDGIVSKHGLKPHRYDEIVAWGYPESVFNSDYDIVSSTTRARLLGFHDMVDTQEMFLRMFAQFRRDRVIP